jgi:surface polysaccharide O-acyltransferase-like enzyme
MRMDHKTTFYKKERNSNIELLGIMAMLLVLIDHSGYMSIMPPTNDEVCSAPFLSFVRYCGQSFSSICVNVFVLISGWFGIKARINRVSEFLFQCYFI